VRINSRIDNQPIEGKGVVVAANCNYNDLYLHEEDNCRWFIITSSHVSMGQDTTLIIKDREFKNFLSRTHDIINDIEILEINKNDFINEVHQEPLIEKSGKYIIYPLFLYETITTSEKTPISIFSGVFSDESTYNLTIDSHSFDFLNFHVLYKNSIDPFRAVRISTKSEIGINNPIYAPIIDYRQIPTPYFDTCHRQSYFEGDGDRLILHCGFVHGMSGSPLLQRLDAISTPPIFYLRGIITQFDRDFNLSMAASHHAISRLMQKALSDKVNTINLVNDDWKWKYSPSVGTYRSSQNLIETLVYTSVSGNQTTADGGGATVKGVTPAVEVKALENQHGTNGLIFIHADSQTENIIGYNYENTFLSANLSTWKNLKESKLLEKTQKIKAGASLMEALKVRSIKRQDQIDSKTKLTSNFWISHHCTLTSSKTLPGNTTKIEIQLKLQNKSNSITADHDTLRFDIDDRGHWISHSKSKSGSSSMPLFMPRHIIRSTQGVEYVVDYQGLFFADITDIAPIDIENYLVNKPQFVDLITNYYSKTPSYIKLRKLTPAKNSCTEYYFCTIGKE